MEATNVRKVIYETNDAYHASAGYSRSQLADAVTSVALFHGRHVSGTMERRKASPAMEFGTLCHNAIVNRRGFMSGVQKIAASALDGAGRRTGARWKAYAERYSDRLLVTPKDYARLRQVVDNVKASRAARLLLSQAEIEVAIEWSELVDVDSQVFELPVKIQLDGLSDIVVEFKTTKKRTEEDFAREILNYRYHFQAAMARRAAFLLDGVVRPVVIIAAPNEEPFADVNVFELGDEGPRDFLAIGEALYERAVFDVAASFVRGDVRPPNFGSIRKLHAPAFGASVLEWKQ